MEGVARLGRVSRLLGRLSELRRWATRDLVTWVAEARCGWLTISVIVASLVVAWAAPAALEVRVRWLGMFFQMLGIATVAVGIRDVRSLFGKPSLGSWINR